MAGVVLSLTMTMTVAVYFWRLGEVSVCVVLWCGEETVWKGFALGVD